MYAIYIPSYWIFFWFLLYIFKIIPFNPKIALIFGVLQNLVLFSYMIYYKTSIQYITYFIIINICIKLIPLIIVWKDKITKKDIYFTIFFFLSFLFLLIFPENRKKFKFLIGSFVHGKKNTPLINLLYNINNFLRDKYKRM